LTFVSTLAKLALSAAAILAIASTAGAQSPLKNDPTTSSLPGSEGAPTGPAADPGFVPRGSPCAANAGNCQELTGTTILDPRTSDLIGGGFSVADNFQSAATGNITAICFTGYYGPGSPLGVNVPISGSEAFRITVWQNDGTGIPSPTPIARIFVGANASTTIPNVTYTGTLTRGSGLGTPSSLANATLYAWTASDLSIPVISGTCYWLEIVAATNALDTNSRWRWANTTHASGAGSYIDGVCLQTANGATPTYASIVNGTNADRAFCLTVGAESNVLAVPACGIPAVPANNLCTLATTISPPYTAPTGTNTYRSQASLTPYCGTNPVNAPTIWYKTVGNGTTYTASTCGAATNFDTVINVYCLSGSTICGTNNVNLLCVANNDIGPAACVGNGGVNTDPSVVSWTATTGVTYYIALFGNFGGTAPVGALDFQLSSDGIQTAAVSCVTDRCPVDLATITGTSEAETCGANATDTCSAAAVSTFSLGTWLKGTVSAAAPVQGVPGNARDIDYWEYNTATALPDNTGSSGQTALTVTWRAEAPIVLAFYTGTCTANGPGTSVGSFVGRYRPSLDGVASNGACGALATDITTNSGTGFRVLVTSPDYGGVPCTVGWNNYAIKLDLAATGACCITGVACTVNTAGQCTASGGTFAGTNVACGSHPCPGACCNNGSCTAALSAASCAASGGAYQGEGSTCALTNCPQPTGICCRGATCNTLLPQPNCTVTGTLAGVAFPVGPSCSGTGISGCCYADYNKLNGIEVQDIFDFINDWLGGSPFANTGGTGAGGTLAVQNIFDFLNNWFAGCTP
jgi:hypothetical protein